MAMTDRWHGVECRSACPRLRRLSYKLSPRGWNVIIMFFYLCLLDWRIVFICYTVYLSHKLDLTVILFYIFIHWSHYLKNHTCFFCHQLHH